jgi:hypothetical protein
MVRVMQPLRYRRFMQARVFKLMSVTALLVSVSAAACLAGERNLGWPAKSSASTYTPPEPMASSTPAPVQQANTLTPPSPYGMVGDPFVRRLNWQSKHARPPAYMTRPEAPPTAAPVVYTPEPQAIYRPSVIMPAPVPAPAMPLDLPPPETRAPQMRQPVTPVPVQPAPAPVTHAEPAQPADPATASVPLRQGAYQIPPTSKYYRGPAQNPPEQSPPTQSVPEQSAPGQTSSDHFVPGEVMTDARTQSPRVYSLHRQYGLQPDAISSISDNAPQPQSEPAPTAKP